MHCATPLFIFQLAVNATGSHRRVVPTMRLAAGIEAATRSPSLVHALLRHSMCRLVQIHQVFGASGRPHQAVLRAQLRGLDHASWLASAACPAAPSAHTPGRRQSLDVCMHGDHSEPQSHVIGLADRSGHSKTAFVQLGRSRLWKYLAVHMRCTPYWVVSVTRMLCGVLNGCCSVQNSVDRTFAALIWKRRIESRPLLPFSTQPSKLQACLTQSKTSLPAY